MFVELARIMGLYSSEENQTSVSITVSPVSSKLGTVMVTIVPMPHKEGGDPALKTPLSVCGKPEQLDTDLGEALSVYAQDYLTMAEALQQASQQMAEAAKAAKKAADEKKAATKPKKEEPPKAPALFGNDAPVEGEDS